MFKYFIFLLLFSFSVTAAPININTANETEIANALNGIGLKKAKEMPVQENFDMRPAPSVVWLGSAVIAAVIVFYIVFW